MWLHGAITTTSHLIATYDKAKGDCVARWYLRGDRDARRRLIEQTLAQSPGDTPTTIVLSLLTQACGPLAPK
jgi:hypothetical protein